MNEITVRTNYTFLSDDGTGYTEDHSFKADPTSAASLPKRYGFTAIRTGCVILGFGTDTEQIEQLQQSAMFMIVNRDPNNAMTLLIQNAAGGSETRTLGPLAWAYFNVAELTVGATFSVAASRMTQITASCDAASVRGELITIYKATS